MIHVTLGGKVGTVTISIHSSLPYPVRVGLQVTSNSETVTAKQHDEHELYLVPPGSSTGVKLNVSAATTGNAKVTLRLAGRSGKLLPNPPDKPLTLELSATNLGTVALVIFSAALAIFVIASAAQALRRGRPGGTDPARSASPGGRRPPGSPRSASRGDDPPEPPTAPNPNHPRRAGRPRLPRVLEWVLARWPGLVGSKRPGRGPKVEREPHAAPDRPDNVVSDRSELSPAGPAPGHRPTEETR